MNKSKRTFSLAPELSRALDILHKRQGDHTYHVEQALRAYGPVKKILKGGITVIREVHDSPKGFIPPTQGEAANYFQAQGNNITTESEASKFIDFYESKGWMVGKNKMKSWKAAVRNWMRKRNENTTGSTQQSQRPTRRSLTQRTEDDAKRIWAEAEAEEARQRALGQNDPTVQT